MIDADELHGFGGLLHGSHRTSTGSTLSFYYTNPSQTERTTDTVLVLLHGWPQMFSNIIVSSLVFH